MSSLQQEAPSIQQQPSPLQQDSQERIDLYQRNAEEARQQRKAGLARDWTRLLEEERRILAMIKRVEKLDPALSLRGGNK
jgi:hypothetical protein